MLADTIDAVIGVDTHRDTHTAAITDTVGRHLDTIVIAANGEGYLQLIAWAGKTAPGARLLWALEGTRSHGAGLTRTLKAAGATVTEVDRPTRRARRNGKSDPIDALLAARSALAADTVREPRADGARDAARLLLVERDRLVRHRTAILNQMRDLVMTAPEELRSRLRGKTINDLLATSAVLREHANDDLEVRVRICSLRRLGRLGKILTTDAKTIETDLLKLTKDHVPQLIAQQGVGPIVAAQLWISWSHPGRIRSESAFAALAGASPLEASSGQRSRHRLNRGGDRHLNRALHQIMITRLSCDPATRAYVTKRVSEGKTSREAQRCIKRYLARRIWRLLEQPAPSAT